MVKTKNRIVFRNETKKHTKKKQDKKNGSDREKTL